MDKDTGLRFDAERHEYWLGDQRIPGVTEILGGLTDLDGIQQATLDRAARRGQAAHRATELFDAGTLDYDTLAPALAPYLEAWRRFRDDTEFVPEHIELRVFHPALRYAGTLDRIGVMRDDRWLIDIKTTTNVYPAVGPQTAAYAEAARAQGTDPGKRRGVVRLQKDGHYKLHECRDTSDFAVFCSIKTLAAWASRNKTRVHYAP